MTVICFCGLLMLESFFATFFSWGWVGGSCGLGFYFFPSLILCSQVLEKCVQIRTIMVENIEKILERGDRIELLVDKTATMQDGAFHFKKQSKGLRRALWMKNAKLLYEPYDFPFEF